MSKNLFLVMPRGPASCCQVCLYQTPTEVTRKLLWFGNKEDIFREYVLWVKKDRNIPEIPEEVAQWLRENPDASKRDYNAKFGGATPKYNALYTEYASVRDIVLHEDNVRKALGEGARFSSI